MTLLATLYPAFNSTDFDLEAATESLKALVITFDDAVRWAENEMNEGRGEKIEWERKTEEIARSFYGIPQQWVSWNTECNENNEPEEWILTVQDVPFATF
jgi:hypothetical protein